MTGESPDPAAGAGEVAADALRERVEAALRRVRDPDVDRDVFEAGLVESIRVDGADVTIVADLADFRPAQGEQVMGAMLRAVTDVDAVERAHVEHAPPQTTDRTVGIAGADRVIAVASAKGGVGKTTVAAGLACALADDANVGVFDADLHGPNLPDVLRVSGPVYADDEDNPIPASAGGLEVMSVGLMESGAPLAWRGAMAHDALSDLLETTAWDDRDTIVVDLPPGTGDVALTTLQDVRLDGVVFVTTPFHSAVADTARSVELFRENDVPVLGVVVNMTGFECEDCGRVHDMYPDGERPDLDAPTLAELPFSPDFQTTPRPGAVPAAFDDLARRVRERHAEVWEVTPPDDAVDLRGVPAERRHDRVATAYEGLDAGEEFHLVSDRDPSPVVKYLAELAGVEPGDHPTVAVRQPNPETYLLRTRRA